jgi:predicted ATPase
MMSYSALPRGAEPPIVESFRIEGLYGYRTISLDSQFAATILIAKNGSGKTTLLATLNAFLSGQFSRLVDLKFLRICCKLRGVENELILTHDDVASFFEIKPGDRISREAQHLEINARTLFKFIVEEDDQSTKFSLDNEVYTAIMRRFNYSRADIQAFCDNLRQSLTETNPAIQSVLSALKISLNGTEIVYLPTYRRIELPLNVDDSKDRYGRRKRPSFRFMQSGLYPSDIQFGLSDISDRLAELNQTILVDSNLGYRQISASIINELLDGTLDRGTQDFSAIPDQEELELFFSRLKDKQKVAPFIDVVSVPNIDKIYTGADISGDSNKFLRYFLSKLNTVLSATRDIESKVTTFINSCNSYLSFEDESVVLPDHARRSSSADDKALRLNRKDLKVHVESLPAGRKISLNSLSSGEKQMISLFGKLFLYPKNKIFLIDEPELSLSLDWQRRILVDVMNAPSCSQIIAITHSPFIFDNDLEPFARSLMSSIDSRGEDDSSLPDDIEDDLHE